MATRAPSVSFTFVTEGKLRFEEALTLSMSVCVCVGGDYDNEEADKCLHAATVIHSAAII